MNDINLHILSKDDWQVYKSLRLASLKDSPDSFGATYERESKFPDGEWISRLDPAGRAAHALPLVAVVDGTPSGLAWGLVHDANTRITYVYQMWVAPEVRGIGVGRALLNEIISWAQRLGHSSVELAVTTTNLAASSLYHSSGFKAIGEVAELRPASELRIQPMVLELNTGINGNQWGQTRLITAIPFSIESDPVDS